MGCVGWKQIPRTGPEYRRVSNNPIAGRILGRRLGLTVMLVITVHERAHLVVPQLDGTIVQRGSEKRLPGVCKGYQLRLAIANVRGSLRKAMPLTLGLLLSN